MFGLTQKVCCRQFPVTTDLIADHERLGRSSKQINSDAPKQLSLGLRDKGVAGTDQDINWGHRRRADSHRADRLNPAERVNLVGARHRLRGHNGRCKLAMKRRRACSDAFDACNLGGNHRHMGRGEQWIFPTWNIAACRIHWHMRVAKDNAGQRFNLDVFHRVPLDLREVAHLGLREFDILQILTR